MNGDVLFLVSTLATWIGIALVCRGGWIGIKWLAGRDKNPAELKSCLVLVGVGAASLLFGTGVPHSLGRSAPGSFWVPIVWPIMPFPAWFIVLASMMTCLKLVHSIMALTPAESSRLRWNSLLWIAFGGLNLRWLQLMGEEIKLLRGAVPMELETVVGIAVLFIVSLALIQLASRSFRSKGLSKSIATYLALSIGSAIFCLPLLWLLLTSFKEKEDNTGAGLVWIPMVTQRHDYFDDVKPLVSTVWRGQKVWATMIKRGQKDRIQLDIERPFPLRGWRISAEESSLKREPRSGIVVEATFQAQKVTGFVRQDLVGGEREVEILSPASLAGRKFTTTANETKPVRHPGVRWENYSEAVEWLPPETENGLRYVKNTLWLVFMSVVGTLLSCSLVAYGFSRIRFPGRGALFGVMLATMMLPGAVTMMPRFLIWRGLGAIDTLVPIWLPTFTASAFYVFLLREFFKTVPIELEDAAKMDGCNPLRTYWQVMLPQVKPALTVIGIWTFMGAWNDFMSPLIYVSSAEKMPISYAIQLFSTDKGGEFGLMMAFATMATIPVLIVFLLGQRFFVEGVQLSGLGGR